MRPTELFAIRVILAFIWLTTGAISLLIFPVSESLDMLSAVGLYGDTAVVALYLSAAIDVALGIATLLIPSRALWIGQASLICFYTLVIAVYLPAFCLHPFGPILKNLALLMLLWLLFVHQEAKT